MQPLSHSSISVASPAAQRRFRRTAIALLATIICLVAPRAGAQRPAEMGIGTTGTSKPTP